ncbi:DUF4350 domain-containing protein [Halobaculum limi]|uniref:DUF4350 domain-containing protein n=1 Tax=Halobaculum limi TaxID=3031916 RepID=UPI0024049B8C|nr:DUF4350 domain-containing protein [Halobaculum sp. YSMS11]
MRLWPDSWGYPHALLIALVVVMVGSVVFAGATSAAAFGSYNPSWDGASQLRGIATDTGGDSTILTETAAYETVEPNGTVAVVLSPDRPYTESQRAALRSFVRDGGTLVVAEDYGPIGNSILSAVGASVRVSGQPLRDEREYYRGPALPVAPSTATHPVTDGVDELTLNHGTVLVPAQNTNASTVAETNATAVVNSSGFSYLDRNRNEQLDDSETLAARPVVAVESIGEGQVIAVADPSVFINSMLEREGNQQFATNIIAAHDRILLDYSHTEGQPPLIAALLALQKSSLLTVTIATLVVGSIGLWTRRPDITLPGGSTVFGGDAGPPQAGATDDGSAVVAYLREQHPDWSERRLRRLMTAVFTGQPEDSDNE